MVLIGVNVMFDDDGFDVIGNGCIIVWIEESGIEVIGDQLVGIVGIGILVFGIIGKVDLGFDGFGVVWFQCVNIEESDFQVNFVVIIVVGVIGFDIGLMFDGFFVYICVDSLIELMVFIVGIIDVVFIVVLDGDDFGYILIQICNIDYVEIGFFVGCIDVDFCVCVMDGDGDLVFLVLCMCFVDDVLF